MQHQRSQSRTTIRPLYGLGLALTLLLACAPLHALPGLDRGGPLGRDVVPEQRRPQLRPGPSLTTEEAIAIAERRYQGRAVGAREIGNGVYRVRILKDNGKVKTVTIRP